MHKRNTIIKGILLVIFLCALIGLVFGIIKYNIRDGKSASSREVILKDAYPESRICSEFILDKEGKHIISEFSYNNHLAIAYFKQDESERYAIVDAKVSLSDRECIILEVCMDDKEYYVGAIDQDNLKSAVITFIYENGERDFVEKEVSVKGIFLCERPTKNHNIIVDYRQ